MFERGLDCSGRRIGPADAQLATRVQPQHELGFPDLIRRPAGSGTGATLTAAGHGPLGEGHMDVLEDAEARSFGLPVVASKGQEVGRHGEATLLATTDYVDSTDPRIRAQADRYADPAEKFGRSPFQVSASSKVPVFDEATRSYAGYRTGTGV